MDFNQKLRILSNGVDIGAARKINFTGAALTELDVTDPSQVNVNVPAATWTGVRYFAVDYDSGNDTNAGYSDVSMAAAGAVALKTLERLRQIFPINGNGRTAVIVVKARAGGATYRNIADSADDDLMFNTIIGYQQLVIRGTGTVASAGATAFANDAADKVTCGAQIFAGTNAAGYNPSGVPTTSVFTCVLAGGGAPGLAAEPALLGKRIRFDSATATVALRNAVGMIWLNTGTSITLATNLSTAPSTSDVFYIEEPAVAVGRIVIKSSNQNNQAAPPSFAQSGIQVVGFKGIASAAAVMAIRGPAALVNCAFLDFPNNTGFSTVSVSGPNDFRMTNSYTDEAAAPATITVGSGVRCEGGATTSNIFNLIITHCVNAQARFQILNCFNFSSIGSSSVSVLGVLLQGCGISSATTAVGGNSVGNQGSASNRRLRTTSTFTESISITRSHVSLYGIDITGVGTTPCVKANGVGLNLSIDDVVGSTGNTDEGLDLTAARDCHLLMGTLAANTFTGAAGHDIVGAGPVFYVHADYARTNLFDGNRNHIQGSGPRDVVGAMLVTNDASADIGQYKVVRVTGSGVVRAAQADTAAKAGGVCGVSQSAFTAAGPQLAMVVSGGSSWVQFDAAPTAGNIAYLSDATIGNAKDAPPALAGTNQKLRLGRIVRVSGTLGLVSWHAENLPVISDGLA